MIGFERVSGCVRGVTDSQFWFAVTVAVIVGGLFYGMIRYADMEASQEPTEQEKEEFWQRLAERESSAAYPPGR